MPSHLPWVASEASGIPAPTASDTVVWDTREGGAQSIQGSTDIADADSDGAITINNMGSLDSWDTDIEGSGKRGYKITWTVGNHQGTEAIIKAPSISGPADVYFQMIRRQEAGFHNAQGGAGGRKNFVWFRDSGGGNDARMTCEIGGSAGSVTKHKLMVGTYTGFTGTVGNEDGEIARVNLYGHSGNINTVDPDNPFDIDSLAGTAVTMTYRIRSESAANAGDGILEAWFNGTLCQRVSNCFTGPNGFYELQIGGPTWNAVTSESIEWYYDFLMWRATSF